MIRLINDYSVTKLPEAHHIAFNGIEMDGQEFKESELGSKISDLPRDDSHGFFKRFGFTTEKNQYHDIVDECNDMIYAGSETKLSHAVHIRNFRQVGVTGTVYSIDSSIKYSLTCAEDGMVYAKNSHYMVGKCVHAVS